MKTTKKIKSPKGCKHTWNPKTWVCFYCGVKLSDMKSPK